MLSSTGNDVGLFGSAGNAPTSVHVDEALQNVAVGPDVAELRGKRNVLLGTRAGLGAARSSDNVLGGWAAGGSAGPSNVVIGSRAGQYLQADTSYSVILGALAGFGALSVTNSVMVGSRIAGGVATVANSTLIGTDVVTTETVTGVSLVATNTFVGDAAAATSERITGHVSNSWLTGSDIVAFGNAIVTESGMSGVVAMGDDVTAGGTDSLLVGKRLSSGVSCSGNQVFGVGTRVLDPHVNVLALGAGPIVIDRSDVEYIGTGIVYDKATGVMDFLGGGFAVGGGSATFGGGVLVIDKGVGLTTQNAHNHDATFETGLTLTYGLERWTMKMEPGEYDQYDLVFESDRGTRVVFNDNYEPGVTNFTGQHRCKIREGDLAHARVGQVVCATGEYAALDGRGITVDEAIPVVELSRGARDARAFGVVSDLEAPGPTRSVSVGFLRFVLPKPVRERRVRVNGCGEGAILVCGENGDVRNGDLLCTSSLCGVAMRQLGEFVTNYTCAKATGSAAFRGADASPRLVGCVYKFS
jgi:hypothetical protein